MGNTTSENIKPITKCATPTASSQVDTVTGLPSKHSFSTTVEELVNTGDVRWVLAMIDVDRLSKINETESRQAGDIIIQTVGRAIQSLMEQNKERFVGFRWAEDKFYIFIHCREGKKSFAEQNVASLICKIENTTTSAEWTERVDRNTKHRKKRFGGNGFCWDVKKKSKKKKAKTEAAKPAISEEEKTNDIAVNDWYSKYQLNDIKNKLIKDWPLEKLRRIKDANAVCKQLGLKQIHKIRFKTAIDCLRKSCLILQKNERVQLKADVIHRYDYIVMNERSSLTTVTAGMLCIECFELIMKSGAVIDMNGKGQENGAGEGGNVYVMKMPVLGQPRGGGGGGGYGSAGVEGTVGRGGAVYGSRKLLRSKEGNKILVGSAGGSGYSGDARGSGGGGIKLACLEKFVAYKHVKLMCNGSEGVGCSGGGSGGSIYLRSPCIQIVNRNKFMMSAIGGRGGAEGGGDGGEGRIRIDCNNEDFEVLSKNIQPAIGYKGKFK